MERTNPPIQKLSETLSSDSLFTFTSRLEYLMDMLEHGIRPRYIFERLPIPNRTWYYIVAAKCFCDIPLGKIKSHLNWFGNYGLGINKTYLRNKGVSPLMYIHGSSQWIIDSLKKRGIEDLESYSSLPFLKRQSGADYKREEDGHYKKTTRNIYDEREWRFIPKENELITGNEYKLIKNGLEAVRVKNIENPYNKSSIHISPEEIEYIIIDNFSEFSELKKMLRILYKNDEDYEWMLSKILIARRIMRDF